MSDGVNSRRKNYCQSFTAVSCDIQEQHHVPQSVILLIKIAHRGFGFIPTQFPLFLSQAL